MFADNECFKKLKLKSFPEIQQKLLVLHRNKFFPIKKIAVSIAWTRDNYLDLFDEINELASSMNTSVMISKFFITPPYDILDTHIDNIKISQRNWALNIPILSHDTDHYMIWYDYQGEAIRALDSYRNSLRPKNPEKLKIIEKLTILEPHYVKIGIFHKVENLVSTPRIMLTIRFRNSFVDV